MGQFADQCQRARHGREGLKRMDIGQARQARHTLIEPRIMLHGAGAERKHPGIDAVVVARQPHIMAQRLRLGEPGQTDRRGALEAGEPWRKRRGFVEVDTADLGSTDLENLRLLGLKPAMTGEG